MTRVASGLTLAILALALILYGSEWLFLAVMEVVAVICLIEYYVMMDAGGKPALKFLGTAAGAGLLAVFYTENGFAVTSFTGAAVVTVTAAAVFTSGRDAPAAASNTLFGVFYVAVSLGSLALIRKSAEGGMLVITLIAANAMADTFAYYTGRMIGRTPLAPSISPKKTWEGFAGGVIGALAAAMGARALIAPFLGIADAAAIGLIAGLLGPAGDLAESSIKRSVGVKDSGRIIPGHGGALDRLDSLMFSSVFFYIYLRAVIEA